MKKLLVILLFAFVFVGCKDKDDDVDADLTSEVVGTYLMTKIIVNGVTTDIPSSLNYNLVVSKAKTNEINIKINADSSDDLELTDVPLGGTKGAVTFQKTDNSGAGNGTIAGGLITFNAASGGQTLTFIGQK